MYIKIENLKEIMIEVEECPLLPVSSFCQAQQAEPNPSPSPYVLFPPLPLVPFVPP